MKKLNDIQYIIFYKKATEKYNNDKKRILRFCEISNIDFPYSNLKNEEESQYIFNICKKMYEKEGYYYECENNFTNVLKREQHFFNEIMKDDNNDNSY